MKTNRPVRLWPLLLILLLVGCQGPDPLRVAADRADHKLAQRCADGWFLQLPFTAEDERLVRQALDDWARRLASDDQLLGGPGGGK
jgi:hypothetical protein